MPRLFRSLPVLSYLRLLALAALPGLTVLLAGTGPLALGVAFAQAIGLWLLLRPRAEPAVQSCHAATTRDVVEEILSHTPRTERPESLQSAALVLLLDQAGTLHQTHGPDHVRTVMAALALRLGAALREGDRFCVLSTDGFGVALAPQRRMAAEAVLSVADRLQTAVSRPVTHQGVTHWPTVSVGVCLSRRAAELNGLTMLDAATQAARSAQQRGPGGLDSYSVVELPAQAGGFSMTELRRALDQREIRAYFQPQIVCATGAISGLEALARWHHPERGVISPGSFLPAIDALDLAPRLTSRMLGDSLDMLNRLDAQGLDVPCVGINLSEADLRSPDLADRVAWDLDAHDLTPQRLVLEILETVVAGQGDDQMVATIARLAAMGCAIDLDDFGTGSASITGIRRFAAGRLKIDRSFTSGMISDLAQRRVVSAILSMATELGLDTLAEGVEDAETLEMLTRMGCGHAQGFHIARPMAADDLCAWLNARHGAETRQPPTSTGTNRFT